MFIRLAIVQIIFLGFQSIMYFGCEIFQHNLHDVKSAIDDRIPFIPATSLSYSLWFPLIAVFPLAVYYADPSKYRTYMITMLLEIIISVICYLIYPTTFERPTPPDTFWGKAMKVVYTGSFKGVNCAPSLHCSSCFLIMYIAVSCAAMPWPIRLISIVVAIAIVISTMTTKQHTVIDVATAVILFAVCLAVYSVLPTTLFEPVLNFICGA